MADTIREKIIAALKTGLTNYEDFVALDGASIHRGITHFDPNEDPPPLITILPRPEYSEETVYGADLKTMQVDFSSLVAIGSANPSELGEAVLGEIHKAVFSINPSNVSAIVYRSGGVDEYPEGDQADIVVIGMTVDYVFETESGDPYTAV